MGIFKGTKGKWEVFKPNHIGCTNVSIGDNNGVNAYVELWHHNFDDKKSEAEANAKLISCAPEMLEMLEELIHFFEDQNNSNDELEILEDAKELIKKATDV